MIIQNISCNTTNNLTLAWNIYGECKALSIQIGKDAEFTRDVRTFCIPRLQSCIIETASGEWFVRIGAWVGNIKEGTIQWSGIVGPFNIVSTKPMIPAIESSIKITGSSSIVNGLQLQIKRHPDFYCITDYSISPSFNASDTHTVYSFEVKETYIDCLHMQSHLIPLQFSGLRDLTISPQAKPVIDKTYYVRVSNFVTGGDTLPENSVKQLAEGVSITGNPKAAIRPHTTADLTTCIADKVLQHESKNKKTLNFKSYADYLQNLNAKTRMY
jgi:hypothetical protein